MPRRLFIGTRPDEKTLKNIRIFQEEFSHIPVHWAGEENIHVTLVPPWKPGDFEQTLSTFRGIKTALAVPALTFTQIQLNKSKRIVWAVGKAPDNLTALVEQLTSIFQLPKQNRKFLMHITLAKHVDQTIELPDIKISWQFVPESLILFESIQTKAETVYNKISEIPLG